MTTPATAAMLYDLVECSHRVTMDLYGDQRFRDEPNAFVYVVKLSWADGILILRGSSAHPV